MQTITFKSTPENWIKEARDIKCNTVRFFTEEDDYREVILELFIRKPFDLNIELVNTESKDSVLKEVVDVTMLKCPCNKRWYIISW